MSDKELEERIRNLEVRQAMSEQKMDTMVQDVKEIKDTLTWLNRLAVGAIVLAVINLVIKTGGIS